VLDDETMLQLKLLRMSCGRFLFYGQSSPTENHTELD